MIVRTWRGFTPAAKADEYEEVLRRTGLADYVGTPGNKGAYFTRREHGDRTEFFVISMWESWEAVKAFAGDEPEVAVYYPEDDEYLLEKEHTVDHYEVFASA
ncbi:hypothetical protein [Nonomuraea sediminis]|uniref:hypothetical protein n=1 Tax=Nonomuraea sediminis TaxID=2835864 RepID=UPI001BDBF08B|nr:hypothetical protein [Nonomuraea sediminis]